MTSNEGKRDGLSLCLHSSQSYLFKNQIRSHYCPAANPTTFPITLGNEPKVLPVTCRSYMAWHLAASHCPRELLHVSTLLTQASLLSLEPARFLSSGFYAVGIPSGLPTACSLTLFSLFSVFSCTERPKIYSSPNSASYLSSYPALLLLPV